MTTSSDRALVALFTLCALASAGCGSDSTGLGPDASPDTETGNDADGGASDDSDGAGTGGLTGTPGDDSGADETGGDGGAPSNDVCDLDCGPGTCQLDEGDTPTCDCPAGTAAVGSTCLTCEAASDAVAVDIPTQTIAITLTLGGDPFPSSVYEDGHLVLVERVRGDEVVVGNSHEGATLSATVIPGDYELMWRHESGTSIVPRNANARLGRVGIDASGQLRIADTEPFGIGEDGSLVVDVPVAEVSGTITLGGATPPTSVYETGQLVLLAPATGDEVVLGATADGTFTTHLIPGTYELHYRVQQADNLAPRNADAYLRDVVVGEGADADFDVPVVHVQGAFTFDGAPAPTSVYERGRVLLRDRTTGDEVDLGFTSDGEFDVPVVPGSYELVYRWQQGNSIVPRNHGAVVRAIDVDGTDATVAIDTDIETATVAGALTIGQAVPPTDPANTGEIWLRATDSDDEVQLGETLDGSYSAVVIPGSFEVYYAQKTASGAVPENTNARVGAVNMLAGDLLGDVDVPVSSVSGEVLLNGTTPPDSEYDDGRIYLRNAATGDSVLLGSTRLGAVDSLVVPGEYDVYYVVETAGLVVPQNSSAYLTTVTIAPGLPLDLPLDIPVQALTGTVTVAGAAPPQSPGERAILFLEDANGLGDDVLHLGEVAQGGFSIPLTAGTYVLYYEALQSSGVLPLNSRAALSCWVLGD